MLRGSKAGAWMIHPLICFIVSLVSLIEVEGGGNVPMVLLKSGVEKGAVCLDGSPAAYHFEPGSGTGANNWIIHVEGGGWCHSIKDCIKRKGNFRGSSKLMRPMSFSGPLGGGEKNNPDFYNWNRIKIRYCDGSSFTGDVEEVDNSNNLHFRGARIFSAMMDEFLAKGMDKAENALLGGCSAGGLTAILHCDMFRDLLPKNARVKCFADAGYFVDVKDVTGSYRIRELYSEVVAIHNSSKHLPAACLAKYPAEKCFFPQYVAETLKTPLFIFNAAYDSWQVRNILVPTSADEDKKWDKCKDDITKCNPEQMKALQGYRDEFLKALPQQEPSKNFFGAFILSCHAHCQGGGIDGWIAEETAPKLQNITVSKAIGDWFFDRAASWRIDCPYPCNPTCQNSAGLVLNS